MPRVGPVEAWSYDPARVELDRVLAPPYDVIDAAERARLGAEPHAFVHLDLPSDGAQGAARRWQRWLADGVMAPWPGPAMFRYDQAHGGVTRRTLLLALEAGPWGAVRPHERTLEAPVRDRRAMIATTALHLSPVFAALADPEPRFAALLDRLGTGAADRVGTTGDGTTHRLWAGLDPTVHAEVAALLAPHRAVILDGHHRYEAAATGGVPMVLAAIVDPGDPGLRILPTHRLIHGRAGWSFERALAAAAPGFAIERVTLPVAALEARLAGMTEAGLGLVGPAGEQAILSLAAGTPVPGPAALGRLPVHVAHALFLERGLGITAAEQAAQSCLRYVHDAADACAQVARGEAQLAVLLAPPTVAQVCRLAAAGERMPQKATYFFPKLASGLVVARA